MDGVTVAVVTSRTAAGLQVEGVRVAVDPSDIELARQVISTVE